MISNKQTVAAFLDKYKMSASSYETDSMLESFISEMVEGLTGQDSSLAMLNSYISPDNDVPANKPVIVLDAGGTNLRVCIVTFDEHGKASIEHFNKYPMPGIAHELSKKDFYDTFYKHLEPVIDKANAIGFCFSYPIEISSKKDGKLLYWTKEVKVPEVVGEYIGAGLIEALAAKGHINKKVVLLNDTIACLLAGKAVDQKRQYSNYIGFILGTGTNSAYVENNINIGKVETVEGSQVINIESGNYGRCPQGEIDKIYDATTANPEQYTFEKMISGRYLGDITLQAIKLAVTDGLFSESGASKLEKLLELKTADLSFYLENQFNVIAPFDSENINDEDRLTLYHLTLGIIERAAKLTAVNMAAAIIKSGSGTNPLQPVCINIDGSTYHKLYGFRAKCESYLNEILNARSLYFETIEVDNAPVLGTAIAGLVG